MRTLWHKNISESEIIQTCAPTLNPTQIRIKSLFSAISSGTERLVCSGLVNNKTCYESMKVPHMLGDFSLPCTYGYSSVGEIVELGNSATEQLQSGQLVHVMHPHQDEIVIDHKSPYLTLLPDEINPVQAVLISNLETVINAIWDAEVDIGDAITILGFGGIGALLALTLKSSHFGRLSIIEPNKARAQFAGSLGFETHAEMRTAQANIVFNTTSNSQALNNAIQAMGTEGKIVELSWYGNKEVKLNLGDTFHFKRLQIKSSQVSSIPERKASQWDAKKRKQLAIELIMANIFSDIKYCTTPFLKTPDFFKKLRKNLDIDNPVAIIDYQS